MYHRMNIAIGFILLCFAHSAMGGEENEPAAYDPTDHYEEDQLEGWKLLVNRDLIEEEPELCEELLTLVRHQLYNIKRVLPDQVIDKLQTIPIWVELRDAAHPSTAYHPDRSWLVENGLNPDKTHCVEIGTARSFVRSVRKQPWVMLHELAHAWHHQFLEGGFGHAEILAAYEAAMDSGDYEGVLLYNGRTVGHYARTNQMEYFAESTEAYFGVNDFYPFVRAELREHDPQIFEVLAQVWEVD